MSYFFRMCDDVLDQQIMLDMYGDCSKRIMTREVAQRQILLLQMFARAAEGDTWSSDVECAERFGALSSVAYDVWCRCMARNVLTPYYSASGMRYTALPWLKDQGYIGTEEKQ